MTETIKLVACDMDGTLLNKDKKISRRNIEAVSKLQERGIYFVIATGRHDSMVKEYLDKLGLEMPVISCNGAMVREPFTNRLYSSIPLQPEQVLAVISVCKSLKADYHIYCRDVIYGETLTNRMFFYKERNKRLSERDQIKLDVDLDFNTYIQEKSEELYKILIIPEKEEHFPLIQQEIASSTGLEAFQSDASLLDVAQKGITKAHAIENLISELGIKREETAAIGDQLNDLAMIQYAGLGIAMENAVPEVKKAAQFVTGKCHNQNGVAEALEYILAH